MPISLCAPPMRPSRCVPSIKPTFGVCRLNGSAPSKCAFGLVRTTHRASRGGTTSAPDSPCPGSAALLAAPAGPARIAQLHEASASQGLLASGTSVEFEFDPQVFAASGWREDSRQSRPVPDSRSHYTGQCLASGPFRITCPHEFLPLPRTARPPPLLPIHR